MWRRLCLILLLLGWAGAALPQRDPLDEPRFVRVSDSRSIGDQIVTALAQDGAGLLWVGTPTGLLRYDGYQMRPYPVGAPPGQRGKGTSFVRTLVAAPGGVLWVGLEGEGLARLDTQTHAWTLFAADPADPGALANGNVRALALQADGTLWVGTTGGGLHRLDPGASRFIRHQRADGSLPDDRVQALHVDRQGTLWVGTWSGLLKRVPGGEGFEPVSAEETPALTGSSLTGRVVSLIQEGPDGALWVGTRQGDLLRLDVDRGRAQWLDRAPVQGRLQRLHTGVGGMPAGGAVVAMAVADADEVWIGRDNGLELRHADTGALQRRLQRDLRKPWGLGGNNVVALLRDRAGTLWAGSYGGGLQRHSPGSGLWVRRGEGGDDSVLVEGDTRALLQLVSGEIWAGMHERGIAVLDSRLRLQATVRVNPDGAQGYTGGQVGGMAQRGDGVVFVGTDTGVHEFDDQRRWRARHVVGQGRARRLLAAGDGAIWVGSQDGVYRLAPGERRFERLRRSDGAPVSGNINALAEAADGSIWVGGNSGLYRLAPGDEVLLPVVSPPGAGLRKQVVLGVLLDRHQRLWVDTNAGLHRAQAVRGAEVAFEHVADQDGGSVGANLLDDAQGRIWTHQGMFDPDTGRWHGLGEPDGADIGTGWFRSYTALADGRLLFGGSTGILVVEPARFSPWAYAPGLVVAELRIDGEKVPPSRLQPALVLDQARNAFSLEFAALDYGDPQRNRYRFRLLGADAEWTETGADLRVASYRNLAPGNYRLIVQGSNRAGRWSSQVLDVAVQVPPAWWQTVWARALGVSLVLALVAGVVQLRTRWLRRRQAELEAAVRERTDELQQLSARLQQQTAALEASSVTDPLTGLHNRRFLTQRIGADLARASRQHTDARQRGADAPDDADIVFFLIDIDHFKQVNDTHGHAAGDTVLVQMRDRLQHAFRQGDYIVRWGGEEFLIAARGLSRHRAAELAERARAAVAQVPFVLEDGTPLSRTCSVGFAAWPPAPAWPAAVDWTAAVDLADAALLIVKRQGRDGWLGLVGATAPTPEALRRAVSQPLAGWLDGVGRGPEATQAGGEPVAHLQGSPRLQAWLSAARRGAVQPLTGR